MRLSPYVCLHSKAILLAIVLEGFVGVPGASAATLRVCSSGCPFSDLQPALDAAQPGDTILLRAGESFVGHFRLPVKDNPTGAYILIRSDAPDDALPAAGSRLIPTPYPGGNTSPAMLARLVGRGGQWKTTPVLETAPGAHHYRLQFLEIDGLAQEGWETIVQLGTSAPAQSTLESVPYEIVLDRVFIHGHPTKGQKRCVALDGRSIAVENSYISGCTNFSYDSQAIAGFNGPGPFRIANNHLEASGENILFGGADPRIHGLVPSDIEITRNHVSKPLAWRESILTAPGPPAVGVSPGAGFLGAGMHYFRVVAVLEVATDIGLSAPSPEQGVWVDGGGAAASLTWSGVAGADRYRVYLGNSPGAQERYIETPGSDTTFIYTGAGEVWQAPPSHGTKWNVKNLLELKNAQRVLIDGNVFEQLWPASQTGYAIVLTPRNDGGTAPWSVVRDVTVSNNILRHLAGGINILGFDDINGSEPAGRINIRNNLVYDLSSEWGGASHFVLMTGSPSDVKIDHNTIFHDGMVVLVDAGASSGFEFTNNLAPHNEYGIFGSGAGLGTDAINAYLPGGVVRRNALGGGPASRYPADNLFPDMATFLSQFADAAGADYRLVPGSMFRGAGADGKDLGADLVALANALPPGVSVGGSGDPGAGSGTPGGGAGGGSVPFTTVPVALPGVIQAEDFDEGGAAVAYSDTTAGNSGGQYRVTDVDIEPSADGSGGYNVGWIYPGEWLKYTVDVTSAGTYTLETRVASSGSGGRFHIEVNGVDVTGSLTIPDTGGWQAWTTVTKEGVSLSGGRQVWTVVIETVGADGVVGNINYIRVASSSGGGGTGGSAPFGGTHTMLPGTVEAEDFDDGGQGIAYYDYSSGNDGGSYRGGDMDIAAASDAGGGYTLGWLGAGEWLNYSVSVGATGTYDIDVRVASAGSGGTFHIDVNGVDTTGPRLCLIQAAGRRGRPSGAAA